MSALLVTGTDTGCGKTYVASLILRAAAQAGRKPGYFKPFETGCPAGVGQLKSAELDTVMKLSGGAPGDRASVPYRFALPVSPYTASMREGVRFDWNRLDEIVQRLVERSSPLVVEGAGGVLTPIEKEFTYIDLALRWKLPVVVVIGNRLGCINHARLTLDALRAARVEVAALVLNDLEGVTSPATQSNRWTLEAVLGRKIDVEVGEDIESAISDLRLLLQ